MNKITINNEYDCCGCGACANACPCSAISMCEDKYGVLYPSIDLTSCSDCGICASVCPMKTEKNTELPLYSFASKTNCTDIYTSSSGGLFAAFAKKILDNDGFVCGAVYQSRNNRLTVSHCCVNSLEDVQPMKGSKYVQSNMDNIYKIIRENIRNERQVLFCGTPCQCQAVRNFVAKERNKDCLILIDIVCHGVPGQRLFSDFIKMLNAKYNCEIISFNFRDKHKGWGSSCSATCLYKNKVVNKYFYPSELSYYSLFETCLIMRPSCYKCKYACSERVGDITIGDYWGISAKQPELLKDKGSFSLEEGVSLLLVNTKIGYDFLSKMQDYIVKAYAPLDSVKYMNPQLSHPTICDPTKVKLIKDTYLKYGYVGVDKLWRKSSKNIRFKRFFINRIPISIKRIIKSKFMRV